LKRYNSSGIDGIPAELIHAESETLLSESGEHIYSVWNKEELPQQQDG
jgi:hypothetical protein